LAELEGRLERAAEHQPSVNLERKREAARDQVHDLYKDHAHWRWRVGRQEHGGDDVNDAICRIQIRLPDLRSY
jgi:hypothetical protein